MTPDQIRAYRSQLGLTQEDLAYLLGVRSLAVSRWELGRDRPSDRSVRRLIRLVEIMDTELRCRRCGIAARPAVARIGSMWSVRCRACSRELIQVPVDQQ